MRKAQRMKTDTTPVVGSEEENRPDCPKCGNPMHRWGSVWAGSKSNRHLVQRWGCDPCGESTIVGKQRREAQSE
jgi:tRNA G26 N,N-dimethylase Trm1